MSPFPFCSLAAQYFHVLTHRFNVPGQQLESTACSPCRLPFAFGLKLSLCDSRFSLPLPRSSSFNADPTPLRPIRISRDNEDPLRVSSLLTSPRSQARRLLSSRLTSPRQVLRLCLDSLTSPPHVALPPWHSLDLPSLILALGLLTRGTHNLASVPPSLFPRPPPI
jgi:hypothetical protein